MECGALGTMAVTMLTYPKNLEGSITILGTKGSARIGSASVNKIEHEFDGEPVREFSSEVNYEPKNV